MTERQKWESSGWPCPHCGGRMHVIDSRPSRAHAGQFQIRRRRRCGACDHRVTTYEHDGVIPDPSDTARWPS